MKELRAMIYERFEVFRISSLPDAPFAVFIDAYRAKMKSEGKMRDGEGPPQSVCPPLEEKGVEKSDGSGDGTGYSFTISKHHLSVVKEPRDSAKEISPSLPQLPPTEKVFGWSITQRRGNRITCGLSCTGLWHNLFDLFTP